MNNLWKKIVAIHTCLSLLASPVLASVDTEANACRPSSVFVGYFNGVNTTAKEAAIGLLWLRNIYGTTAPDGRHITDNVFYNYTDGLDDFVETFEQRFLEQDELLGNRFELLLDLISGTHSMWDAITGPIPAALALRDALVDDLMAKAAGSMALLLGNPPTFENYNEHKVLIDSLVTEGQAMVFIAHSQGNLFMNQAYSYTKAKVSAESVKSIHIAPASPILNGPHTLADKDLVINALRPFGTVASNTDVIPPYSERPPGRNFATDVLGHGLIEIYLNPMFDTSDRIKGHITTSLNSVKNPEAEAATGLFTATLTWNGTGDVDLHVFEPGGSHVYYSARNGTSGFLDVDNTQANGPEHYFLSCNPSRIQLGVYQIMLANYSGASSRTATVQINSANDGSLGIRQQQLGSSTGSTPAYTVFNVAVSEDEQGIYHAQLQ